MAKCAAIRLKITKWNVLMEDYVNNKVICGHRLPKIASGRSLETCLYSVLREALKTQESLFLEETKKTFTNKIPKKLFRQ